MEQVFLKLVNMSISASWLVLAVVILRQVLKKAPKWAVCLLWALVAVRLVCPVSFESVLSLIPSGETVPPEIVYAESPAIDSGLETVDRVVNPMMAAAFAPKEAGASVNPIQVGLLVGEVVWVAGMAAMAVYAAVSWGLIRRKVRASVNVKENVWICDYIDSPFILGIVKPKIYLPSVMMEDSGVVHVLAHERAHLKRRDHWWKPLGFALLAVYWFNPVMWVAYILLCRDIEMACDERVIKELGDNEKKKYSEALLSCSVPRRMIAACPLAFGEVGVKARVKSVLNYKKPAFWIIVLAIVACAVAGACFLTDPVEEPEETTLSIETEPVERKLTLEDVRRLARKGDELSRADFAEYESKEVGSGFYIRAYDIDDTFHVLIGSASPEAEPMYYYLAAGEEQIDIRTGDVEEFIKKHQTGDNSEGAGVGHGNANIYLRIPDGWEHETVAEDFMAEFGIAFWPEGVSGGRVKLVYMEQPLGVCGTGLETEGVSFPNGLVGRMGTYDGHPYWDYIAFSNAPGYYVAMTESVEDWWGEYEEQVMEILGSAELGRGIVRQEEAIAAAQRVTGETAGEWSAWYDTKFAVWRVEQYDSMEDSEPRQTVLVDSTGTAVSPDEWGILLTATDGSPVGVTLNCVQSGGTVDGQLMTGQHYWLERWNGTEWETVPVVNENAAWTTEALQIPKEDTTSWKLNWEWIYGTLPEGTYRIGKNISNFRGWGLNEEVRGFYADFEVEQTVEEILEQIIPGQPTDKNPQMYLDEHPEEYDMLVNRMGEETLWYCLGTLLRDRPTDMKGYAMTILCKDIMDSRGEAVDEDWYSRIGPDWFDAFLEYSLELHDSMNAGDMMTDHYAAWVLYYLSTQ